MAGEAQSNVFNIGTATVMLGAPEDLFDLLPSTNSIGLVKNFMCNSEVSYTELSQGVKNSIVDSKMTGQKNMATMEAYEYTTRNLQYALGLDGYNISPQTVVTTIRTASAADVDGITDLPVVASTGIVGGDWIMIQNGTEDIIQSRQVESVTTGLTPTVVVTEPVKMALTLTTSVRKSTITPIGKAFDQDYLAASVVGKLADGSEIHLMLPKIRVTKGFSLGFNSGQYSNLPLEFTIYDSTPSDPHYALCQAQGSASAFMLSTK